MLGSNPPFINWKGIHFNGQHNIHPRTSGHLELSNPNGPGWANPITGSFDDPRLVGRDGRKYGPLPNDWARLNGIYAYGQHSLIDYEIGTTNIIEVSTLLTSEDAIIQGDSPVVARLFNIGERETELTLLVATLPDDMRLEQVAESVLLANSIQLFAAGVSAHDQLLKWTIRDSNRLRRDIRRARTSFASCFGRGVANRRKHPLQIYEVSSFTIPSPIFPAGPLADRNAGPKP